jgi:polyisoprenoid-binding protein YceI
VSYTYTYDPDAWPPLVAGLVGGAIAAIVAAVVSLPLRSPDEIVANSLSVVLAALALGCVSGLLWRRIRVSHSALVIFGGTMAGGFVVAMAAVTLADRVLLNNFIPYAAPLAAVIFITLGFLVPLLAGVTAPVWIAAIPVVIAIGLGIGLFGRGNVASGELGLDDLRSTTTTTSDTGATATTLAGTLAVPSDLAATYTITNGLATYSVDENLRGLQAPGVGTTDAITGTIVPGGNFRFTIDLQTFSSDQPMRDSRVRGWFSEFPEGTFEGTDFALPATAEVGVAQMFDVSGDMTVNDITLPVTWTVEARVEPDGTLSVTGETFIVLTDFGVPIVTAGPVEMQDGATLEVVFSASP